MHSLLNSFNVVLDLPRYAKRIIVFLVDFSLCILTVWLAFYLRLGEFVLLSGNALIASFISIILALPTFLLFGLYKTIFRYSGLSTIFLVFQAVFIYGLLYVCIITAVGIAGIPRTLGFIQPLLMFLFVGGSRVSANYLFGGRYESKKHPINNLSRALIYGAGKSGRQLVSALLNNREMTMLGFIDDDKSLHYQNMNGHQIFSPDDLSKVIETKGVTHILLAIPNASRRRRNVILKNISKYHVVVRTIPSISDIAEGRVKISDLKQLDIDDLLGRETVEPNQSLLDKNISGKIVMVTGAGGSIGSELCRQIVKLKPQKLLLIEISEYALYLIHSEFEGTNNINDKIYDADFVVPILASVQDQNRMKEIMAVWQPDTVYHTAAFKHVPLVEHNLSEGIKNNVFGTLNTASAAIENGVSDFVLISTDKAVRPTNVMGASKRLAEISLQSLFNRENDKRNLNNITKLSMVRFGNVLDSSGSVIPRFRKQITNGGPLTLTHTDITRYFMTITEASQLVIQAGAMSEGGDVFVLDMGQPVKIYDLAKRMVELSGLTLCDKDNPDGDIELSIIGLRPGEKLYEELLLGDNPQPTIHPKIRKAQDPFIHWDELENALQVLKNHISSNNTKEILILLEKLVVGYKPNCEIVDWIYLESQKT